MTPPTRCVGLRPPYVVLVGSLRQRCNTALSRPFFHRHHQPDYPVEIVLVVSNVPGVKVRPRAASALVVPSLYSSTCARADFQRKHFRTCPQGLERAQAAGIPSVIVAHKDFDSREAFEAAMHTHIEQAGAELVCLAGFMR